MSTLSRIATASRSRNKKKELSEDLKASAEKLLASLDKVLQSGGSVTREELFAVIQERLAKRSYFGKRRVSVSIEGNAPIRSFLLRRLDNLFQAFSDKNFRRPEDEYLYFYDKDYYRSVARFYLKPNGEILIVAAKHIPHDPS